MNKTNDMKTNRKVLLAFACIVMAFATYAQVTDLKLNPEKVKKFLPYVEYKHGGTTGFPAWKETNKLQYTKEMWYYSESFYVKRNYLNEGIALNEEIIDISRFESNRKENEEAIVVLPGFKDVLVLLPANKLIYKP